MKKALVALSSLLLVQACANLEDKKPCENMEEIRAQERRCATLRNQIQIYKDKPVTRTTLEEQYQKECIDFRYHRDTFELSKPCLSADGVEQQPAKEEQN